MKLTPEQLALLEYHEQATLDLVRMLLDGQTRSVHGQLHVEVAPKRRARSRLLLEAAPPPSDAVVSRNGTPVAIVDAEPEPAGKTA